MTYGKTNILALRLGANESNIQNCHCITHTMFHDESETHSLLSARPKLIITLAEFVAVGTNFELRWRCETGGRSHENQNSKNTKKTSNCLMPTFANQIIHGDELTSVGNEPCVTQEGRVLRLRIKNLKDMLWM